MGEPKVSLASCRYVMSKLAAEVTGYTVKALERRRQEGVWVEGWEWVKAPGGRILYDLEGYERWVEGPPTLQLPRHRQADKGWQWMPLGYRSQVD
jgi:hypothetical protein